MQRVGFLGMGTMGQPMAKNLLRGGFEVVVWNRIPEKCDALIREGAIRGASPREVAATCAVTFAMLADPQASMEVGLGPDGVSSGIGKGRGYVDMSTVDPHTARRIATAVTAAGGRFLEAPVSGSKQPAEEGKLIFMTAGNRSLYEEVTPALSKMGKMTLYLGDIVGRGAQMKLCVNAIMGCMMAALGEGLALADKVGLNLHEVLSVLDAGAMSNPMFRMKGELIMTNDFPAAFPLKHMQKDLRLALLMGDEAPIPLPTTAVANELFKEAREQGYGDADFAALWKVIRVLRD